MHAFFAASADPSATVQTRMRERITPLLERLRGSDTGKAAGLAGAMIVNNVIALIISVVFARAARRLRRAGGAAQLPGDPHRRRSGDAGRDRARGRARPPRRRARSCSRRSSAGRRRWRSSRSLATVVSILAAPADRRPGRRHSTTPGRPPPASRPAACISGCASCAARCRAIGDYRSARHQPDRRAGRAAGRRRGPGRARPRARRRLPRLADRLRRDGRVLHGRALPAARRRRATALAPAQRRAAGAFSLVASRALGGGPDRRARRSSSCSRTST